MMAPALYAKNPIAHAIIRITAIAYNKFPMVIFLDCLCYAKMNYVKTCHELISAFSCKKPTIT